MGALGPNFNSKNVIIDVSTTDGYFLIGFQGVLAAFDFRVERFHHMIHMACLGTPKFLREAIAMAMEA